MCEKARAAAFAARHTVVCAHQLVAHLEGHVLQEVRRAVGGGALVARARIDEHAHSGRLAVAALQRSEQAMRQREGDECISYILNRSLANRSFASFESLVDSSSKLGQVVARCADGSPQWQRARHLTGW